MSQQRSKTTAPHAVLTAARVHGSAVDSSLASAWPLILCLVIFLTLSLLLAAHWLAAPVHLPATLGVIPRPWGCGGSSTAC
jgi:hypothetical protein